MNNAIKELLQVAFTAAKDLNLDGKFKEIKYSDKNEDELYKNNLKVIN